MSQPCPRCNSTNVREESFTTLDGSGYLTYTCLACNFEAFFHEHYDWDDLPLEQAEAEQALAEKEERLRTTKQSKREEEHKRLRQIIIPLVSLKGMSQKKL